MKLKTWMGVAAGVACGAAFATAETYVDLPSAQNDFWNTTAHGGVAVDTTACAVATFASGSSVAVTQALGGDPLPAWFVPYAQYSFFTPPRPLDSRDPAGVTIFIR